MPSTCRRTRLGGLVAVPSRPLLFRLRELGHSQWDQANGNPSQLQFQETVGTSSFIWVRDVEVQLRVGINSVLPFAMPPPLLVYCLFVLLSTLSVLADSGAGSALYPPGLQPLINRANALLSAGTFHDAAKAYSEAIGTLDQIMH